MSKLYDIGIADIQKIALFTAPSAGAGDAIKAAALARQRFNDAGVDVISVQARDEATTEDYARELLAVDDIDALVVCGDDTLMNVVLQQQAGSTKPLGLIPAGEMPDLGRSLNIPPNPKRAADIVMRGFYSTADLGRVEDREGTKRWFATIACSGFDARVTERTSWFSGKLRGLRSPLAAVA